LVDAGSDDGFADFPAGTCGDGVAGFALSRPGDCVPGVIAAEGVVGTEGFALGCSSGVAGLTLFAGPGDGATGATAAEGVDGDCFAAGVCDGGVLRSSRPADDGVDVPGAIAAEGVVAVGVCGVPGLAPPPGAGDGVLGVVAAEGDVGVAGVDAGACEGAGPGFVLPGAGDGVLGAIAADGVLGVVGVPGADGRGCPFIPGNGWPGWGDGCLAAAPGALDCAPPPCGDWVWSVAAFCATEGGNAGASEAAGATGAAATAGAACGDAAGGAGTGVACGDTAAGGWAAGAIATEGGTVWVWPLGFVIVTVFVTLLTTTVLWTLL
jgi:hypothetical protein